MRTHLLASTELTTRFDGLSELTGFVSFKSLMDPNSGTGAAALLTTGLLRQNYFFVKLQKCKLDWDVDTSWEIPDCIS